MPEHERAEILEHMGKPGSRIGSHTQSELVTLLFALVCTAACGGEEPSGPSVKEDPFSEAPPAGAERVILTIEEFDLPPGAEAFKCQNVTNPFGRDVAIVQSQSLMAGGSHHFDVWRVPENTDGPLEDCDGLEFHNVIHGAQTPTARIVYPAGVGAFVPGEAGFRLNVHFFNTSTETVRAKAQVALDYVDAAAVSQLAARFYMNDATLMVPPGGGTAGGTLTFPPELGDIHVLRVQSHMHRRGTHFTATLLDGSILYETDSWNEPPPRNLDPALTLSAGSAITWECDIQNETNETLVFGESADTNEMCVVTGSYYPAPEGKTLVGDLALGGMDLVQD